MLRGCEGGCEGVFGSGGNAAGTGGLTGVLAGALIGESSNDSSGDAGAIGRTDSRAGCLLADAGIILGSALRSDLIASALGSSDGGVADGGLEAWLGEST